MRALQPRALLDFANGQAPDPSQSKGISAVRLKVRFGMAAMRHPERRVHIIDAAACALVADELHFAARYLCGAFSTRIVLLAKPPVGYGTCWRCEDYDKGPCVYRCFGEDDELLYVGSALARAHRLGVHRLQTPWWPLVKRVAVEDHARLQEARFAEYEAIVREGPVYNIQHNSPVGVAA